MTVKENWVIGQRPLTWPAAAGLVVAVLAATAMVVLPLVPTSAPAASSPAPATIDANLITEIPSAQSDGSSYALRYVLGPGNTIGTSMTENGSAFRLIQIVNGQQVAELRSLPTARGPQFEGFTLADGVVYWVESVIGPDGVTRSQLWAASAPPPGDGVVNQPHMINADIGFSVMYDSAYDLIVADGMISWVVAADPTRPGTILRSMPVGGGPVTDRGFGGPWRQTERPWLASAALGATALLNLDTGQIVNVPGTTSDNIDCGAQWCRFAVQGPDGPVRLGVMRPDGSQQARITGPQASFPTRDPALLGRYELYSQSADDLPAGDRRLFVYDIEQKSTRLIEVGSGGLAASRGNFVWWISGDYRSPVWHVLDLRALT